MKLHELVEVVSDEASFLTFVDALRRDRELAAAAERASPSSPYEPARNGWENDTIERFLEAAIAWAKDSDFGAKVESSDTNPWKKFAAFLYCGKIYEYLDERMRRSRGVAFANGVEPRFSSWRGSTDTLDRKGVGAVKRGTRVPRDSALIAARTRFEPTSGPVTTRPSRGKS